MVTDMTLPVSAKERLRTEADAWLTTVRSDGQPQSSVIWFWWDNGVMWIRSQPTAGKIANIRRQPRVSVNLNSNGHGDGVVTFEGTAELVDDFPTAVRVAYIAKYEHTIRRVLRMTPERMLADYSTSIRIPVDRVRAW
ncbi:MAG TPA: TIGR03667 family PPOX class F420-dependent oxidoreductase [Jiangellaceae bacterium]|nr:TIGR03667 family PPOX class F420-dependent oxidoreductase [Jiangellaceae bacterium]